MVFVVANNWITMCTGMHCVTIDVEDPKQKRLVRTPKQQPNAQSVSRDDVGIWLGIDWCEAADGVIGRIIQ